MAFDKNQLVMHKLQVKSGRLESGLKRIVGALKESGEIVKCDESVSSAYDYALGCLGGDYLKKELFKKGSFETVVMELKAQKFMKADVAEKNVKVWKEKREGASDESPDGGNVADKETEDCSCDGNAKVFGEVSADGEVVPVKKEQKCEFAEPPAVESKSGMQPSGFRQDGKEEKRGPIYCY